MAGYNNIDLHKEFETFEQTLLLYEEKFSNDLALLLNSTKAEAKIQSAKEKIQNLEKVLEKRKLETKKKEKILEERNNKLQELKATYNEINTEVSDILCKKENMDKDIEKVIEQICLEKETISKQDENIKWKLSEYEKARSWFQDTLGLQFKKTSNNKIQIIFNFINHRKPSKIYIFFLNLEGKGQYKISGCNPVVPNLDDLVKKLHTTNDLSSFILSMRKAFKDISLQG